MTSYKRSIVTMGLSRTVSEINGDFRRNRTKIANFPAPCVFHAPGERVPLGIGYQRRGQKKLE